MGKPPALADASVHRGTGTNSETARNTLRFGQNAQRQATYIKKEGNWQYIWGSFSQFDSLEPMYAQFHIRLCGRGGEATLLPTASVLFTCAALFAIRTARNLIFVQALR
jgi:hypothetical protein